MRRTFRLLKDTPEMKAGAIVEEKAEGSNQDFVVVEASPTVEGTNLLTYWFDRKVIMEQPEWFEEVFAFWVPINSVEKVKNYIKSVV